MGGLRWGESLNRLKGVMDQLEASNQSPQEFRHRPISGLLSTSTNWWRWPRSRILPVKRRGEQRAGRRAEAALSVRRHPLSLLPQVASDGVNPRDSRQAVALARRRERGGKIFRETLAEGDDRIEMDSRLTETGARVRLP